NPRELHSFPTRRSSDLAAEMPPASSASISLMISSAFFLLVTSETTRIRSLVSRSVIFIVSRRDARGRRGGRSFADQVVAFSCARSEEHTSELQSRENLV